MMNFLKKTWAKMKKKKQRRKKLEKKKSDIQLQENLKLTEGINNSQLIKGFFDEATPDKQWEFIHEYKEYGVLILDIDYTTFRVTIDDSFDDEDEVFDLDLRNTIGLNQGIEDLLDSLGIKHERI